MKPIASSLTTQGLIDSLFPSLDLSGLLTRLGNMLMIRHTDKKDPSNPVYAKFVETSPIGHFRLSPLGEVSYINQTIIDMVGFPEEEILGIGWARYLHPEDTDNVQKVLSRALENKEPYIFETRVIRDDGSIWWALSKAEPYYDENNRFLGFLGTLRDITHAKDLEHKLQKASFYDNLTKLPNANFFENTLLESISTANRYKEKLALIAIDISEFNLINSAKGYTFGDQLLILMSKRLQNILRKHDFIARMGGDHFLVLMKKFKTEGDVAALANRIIDNCQKPYELEGHEVHLAVNLGISIHEGDECDPGIMKQHVNSALFRAKAKGKNNFQFYSEKTQARIEEMVEIENHLYSAIEKNELYLVYQPQIDAVTGKLVAYEVLLRWESPELGNVQPDKFIPIAENSRLVEKVGSWVTETALKQHKAWLDKYGEGKFGDISVSINVSPAQMLRKEITRDFINLIKDSGVPSDKVMLEITETTYIRDPEALESALEVFKKEGIKIGIDDFGTGYSSLNIIEKLTIHFLKIDTGFVKNLFVTKHNIAIVKAVCALSKSLKFDLIAEGVETEEQAEMLARIGCNVLQGYLYSKPLEKHDFEERFIKTLSY